MPTRIKNAMGWPNNTVMRRIIANIPIQSGTLTYNGSVQSPVWTNYDPTQLMIGGATSSTNAGTYVATFTPKAGYVWADGTRATKNVSWSIQKAAGSLSISPTSLVLDTSHTTRTISITRAGNGVISATSSNTRVATVSVSGTIVTVRSVNNTNGNATITIKVAEGTNYTAPGNKTCSVTADFGYTWKKYNITHITGISEIAKAELTRSSFGSMTIFNVSKNNAALYGTYSTEEQAKNAMRGMSNGANFDANSLPNTLDGRDTRNLSLTSIVIYMCDYYNGVDNVYYVNGSNIQLSAYGDSSEDYGEQPYLALAFSQDNNLIIAVYEPTDSEPSRGSYVGTVTSIDPNAYPEDGAQGGYWYVKD